MPRAKFSVQLPADLWVRTVTESFDDATLEVVSALRAGETGTAVVEITAPDLPAVIEAMEAAAGVETVELLQATDDRALVQIEVERPVLLEALEASGLPFDTPLFVRDGAAAVTVTGTQDRIGRLGEQLEALGMRYEIRYVRQEIESADLLTEPQRRLLVEAIERGYYDVPRGCTLTDLADANGLAKSSVSERLHRAESAVIRAWAADALPDAPDDAPTIG